MDEKKEIEGVKKEETATDTGTGVQSETAKDTERIRKETEELNKAIAEKQNADARAKIAGVTDNVSKPEEKKEETPKEYADRISKGNI